MAVQGFRDLTGEVWTPNRLVWLESPFLHVTQDMLIEGVTFTQDASGSITRLELVDPKAYGGRTKGQNRSGTQWKQDDSEAQ
jgi:prophage tail gpP-like protein